MPWHASAAIWENWKVPHIDEWMRTFCIITTAANELVGQIHNRMPVLLPPDAFDRWLANIEPDPRDLLVPFPSEQMKIWSISTRVNKPANVKYVNARACRRATVLEHKNRSVHHRSTC